MSPRPGILLRIALGKRVPPGHEQQGQLGYMGAARVDTEAGHPSWYYGNGDLWSTARDLARLDIALMDGRIVKPSTLALMQTEPLPTKNRKAFQGLGVQLYRIGRRTLVGNHGGWPGFEGDDEMFVPDHFAVIALSNEAGFPTSEFLGTCLSSLYPKEMARDEKEGTSTPLGEPGGNGLN